MKWDLVAFTQIPKFVYFKQQEIICMCTTGHLNQINDKIVQKVEKYCQDKDW